MGILDKYQTIEIISEMRNIDKSDVILYNENKYSLCNLIIREEKAIIIQKDTYEYYEDNNTQYKKEQTTINYTHTTTNNNNKT